MNTWFDNWAIDEPRWKRLFWFAFWVSLFVRAVALAFAWNAAYTSDARDYAAMAAQLVTGQRFVPYWPPGLPLFLAPFIGLGGHGGVLRAAMLLFWLLAVWGLYRLAQATETLWAAGAILLIWSVAPGSVQLSIEPLTQMPVAALLLVALSATVRCSQGAGVAEYLLLGASLGFMALIRPSALALFPLLLFPLLLSPLRAGKRVTLVLATLLLQSALVGGWLMRAHQLSGAWVMNTANAQNFWDGNNPWTPMYKTWYFGSHAKLGSAEIDRFPAFRQVLEQTEALPPLQQQARFGAMAQHYTLTHPGKFAVRTLNRVRCYWGFDAFTSETLRQAAPRWFWPSLGFEFVCYMLLAAPAFFWMGSAGAGFWRAWQTWAILGAVVVYAAPYWLSMSHPTYHFPVVVPVAILGAMAWQRDRAQNRVRGIIALAALAAIQLEWVWQMGGNLH